jgi:hypothetical protein
LSSGAKQGAFRATCTVEGPAFPFNRIIVNC